MAGYLDHQPTNVLGVQELIKLAGANYSRLHVLSTLSIFPLAGGGLMPVINEVQLPAEDRVATDGYSRSRYVAERLLEHARTDGELRGVSAGRGVAAPGVGGGQPHVDRPQCVVRLRANRVRVRHRRRDRRDPGRCGEPVRGAVRDGRGADTGGTLHVLWPTTLAFADAFGVLADRGHLDRVSYEEFRRRLEAVAESANADDRLSRLRMMLPAAGSEQCAPREFEEMFAASGRYFSVDNFVRHSAALSVAPTNPVDTLDSYLTGLAATPRHVAAASLDTEASGDNEVAPDPVDRLDPDRHASKVGIRQ